MTIITLSNRMIDLYADGEKKDSKAFINTTSDTGDFPFNVRDIHDETTAYAHTTDKHYLIINGDDIRNITFAKIITALYDDIPATNPSVVFKNLSYRINIYASTSNLTQPGGTLKYSSSTVSLTTASSGIALPNPTFTINNQTVNAEKTIIPIKNEGDTNTYKAVVVEFILVYDASYDDASYWKDESGRNALAYSSKVSVSYGVDDVSGEVIYSGGGIGYAQYQ